MLSEAVSGILFVLGNSNSIAVPVCGVKRENEIETEPAGSYHCLICCTTKTVAYNNKAPYGGHYGKCIPRPTCILLSFNVLLLHRFMLNACMR